MDRAHRIETFRRTRAETERLAEPLTAEDQMVQAIPDASPTKWHRAHTTWFWETFLLAPHGVEPVDPRFAYLFNSYYEALGPRHARPQRGLLSRPSGAEVRAYRAAVDERVVQLLETVDDPALDALDAVLALGIAHEEQHQELILTDILAAFAASPLAPVYRVEPAAPAPAEAAPGTFVAFEEGVVEIGASASDGFAFDNEGPRHKVYLAPFALATRPITVEEVRGFVEDGGYRTPSLWLSEGWDWVQRHGIDAPGYAHLAAGALEVFTLHGARRAHPHEPASHLSFYEADALARFLGGRLPTEAEWEVAARSGPLPGQFRGDGVLVPRPPAGDGLAGLFGGVWEWTRSAYAPYPGFAPAAGAVGEYNGKFMCGQMVLRGGSCFTNAGHVRPTYRNFWPPGTRFQMTGARLARDLR